MDAYMRENKLETVEPQLPPVSAPGTKKKVVAADDAKSVKSDKAEKTDKAEKAADAEK